MRKMRVFIPELICEESQDILHAVAEVKVGEKDKRYTEDELIKIVGDVDAILTTSRNFFTRRVLESAKKLRIIAKYGAKPDNIDLETAKEKGIVVTWTPGVLDDSVAEHTVALMLALCKRLCFMMKYLKNGGWRNRPATMSRELVGKTVGIVGFGSIGYKVARKLQGFDVRILCYDRSPDNKRELAEEVGAKIVDLDTLLKESDIVTLHLTLNAESRGLIGEKELKKMKNKALIINTSRGLVIDEAALYKALKNEWISGAGLDVFEKEPLDSDNPLLGLDNVILTPHTAAWTYESLRNTAFMASEDVVKFLRGQQPDHVINPEVLESVTTDRTVAR